MVINIVSEMPDGDSAAGLVRLFTDSFSDSEGEEEGRLIGDLVRCFLDDTNARDLRIALASGSLGNSGSNSVVAGGSVSLSASSSGAVLGNAGIVAAAVFSRFLCADETRAWLMAPVAVATRYQGRGIGRAMISHALGELRDQGAQLVLTYGDINFYGRTGFVQIGEDLVPAPLGLSLSYPEGWLAQTLDGSPVPRVKGPTRCMKAIDNQVFW